MELHSFSSTEEYLMAKFLNNPATVRLLNTDFRLLLEPLEYDYGAEKPWVVPAGKLSDGPSVPKWIRWLIPPDQFTLSGYLHDDIRSKWSTGNASTDAFLRDAAIAEGQNAILKIKPWQAYLIYLGVRIGTYTGFKSRIPKGVVEAALQEYALRTGTPKSNLTFNHEHFEIRLKSFQAKKLS